MAYLEVISSSGFEKPMKTAENSFINFSWLVALPLAFLYTSLSFWKSEEIPSLKALCLNLLPERVGHLSSWFTPPFLFLVLNFMIMAILFSSGLFSDSSTAASDSSDTVPAANYVVDSSSEDYEDVCSMATTQTSATSTAIVLREESSTDVDTLSSLSITDRPDIVKEDELQLTLGIQKIEPDAERVTSSVLNHDFKQTIQRMEFKEFPFGARLDEAQSRGSVKMEILDDELKSSSRTIFDVGDSPLLRKPRTAKLRSSGSKKLETLCNDCKASPSPIKGRVSLDLDDLHERIEAFINKAREQMRQQEQLASTQRYLESGYGW